MSSLARRLTLATAAGAATLLAASPALAHPSFNPNTVPSVERHTLDLVVPHGCVEGGGAPGEGDTASPTIAVSVRVPTEAVNFIAPHQADGWTLASDGTSFTWSAPTAPTTDPITFQVDVELAGTVTDAAYFTVAQDCEVGSTLWAAGPGEEGDPAAVLFVGEAVGTTEHGEGEGDHGGAVVDGEVVDGEMAEGEHDGEAAEGEHEGDVDHADDEHVVPVGYDTPLFLLVLVMVVGGLTAIIKMD